MLTVFNLKQKGSMHKKSSTYFKICDSAALQYVSFNSLEIHFIAKPFKSKQVLLLEDFMLSVTVLHLTFRFLKFDVR